MGVQKEQATIDLVINGKQSEASLYNITTAAVSAKKALDRMAQTDPGYKQQLKLYEDLARAQQARIVKINQEKTAWEKFKAGTGGLMAGVTGGNIATMAFQKVLELGPAVIDHQLKIRDSFADISKAADMTDAEVKDLNESLKSLDTRTPTEELRNMAVVGGQFGIAKKDMEGFVESADKLNVAMGDQFDSAEKVAETTLTLRNTFQDLKSDNVSEDMMKIGNGLNYLEAQGAATAPVMADFSSRIGGVAIPLGLTSGQVLGLSATLQELNVTAERGSSAMTDILAGIAKAPAQFAKYAVGVDGAKLSTKQFKDLVNTDLNAAFLAVIRGFKEGDTSATGMAAKLADLDIKGNGVMEIFMKLASNTELLTQRQEQSTVALTNTTSITNEFSKKNLELAVNLKKISEWFDSFLENGTLGKFADFVVRATVKILGLSDASTQLAKGYLDQATKVSELEKATLPLLERYDQLTRKTKLTKDEQEELKKITAQVAQGMPAAVTQFDQYANALGISTTKARELIEAQKEMQRQMKQGAIEEQKLQLRSIEWQRQQILEKLKNREEVTVSASGNATARPLSAADITQMNAELTELEKKRKQALDTMAQLEGKAPANKPTPTKPTSKPNAQDGTQETEAERKAREKKEKANERAGKKEISDAQRHEDEYARLLAEARQRTAKNQDNEFLKDQLAFGEHYKKLYELAGNNQQKMDEVTTLMYQELDSIQKQENDRQYKEAKKHSDEMLKLALKDLDNKKTIALANVQSRVAAGGLTKEQGKLAEYQVEQTYLASVEVLYQTHFSSLKTLAGDNQTALTEIAQASADAQAAIDADQTINESSQAEARKLIRDEDLEHYKTLHKQKMQFAQEEKDFRKQMLGEISADLVNDWTSTLKGYKDFWSEATVVQKVALVASKAYALAEIGIQLARQLMLINTAAALADSVSFGFGGTAIRIKGYAIAIGSAAIQTAAVLKAGTSTPAFAEGGFTDQQPGGYTNGPTYYSKRNFIAGEEGKEWIMSAPMLKNPVMANLAGALQALQVSGQWKNLSLPPAGGSSSSSTAGGSNLSDQLLMQLIAETRAGNAKIEAISKRPIIYNRQRIQDAADYEDEITESTSL